MASIKTGLIPAAGKGIRAYPATRYVPKVLLEVGGKTLLLRNLEILRDALAIRDICVILGYMGPMVRDFLGDGSKFGVKITYVECSNPSIGLARGMLLAKDLLKEPFVTILGDELYIDSNHKGLLEFQGKDFSAVCAVLKTNNSKAIMKNYSVSLDGDRISALIEKPIEASNDLLGCGTYLFSPEIFDYIESAAPSPRSGRVELTDVVNTLAIKKGTVYPYFLKGQYCNINSVEDYNSANYVYRSTNFPKYKVSVVIPAYNEEDSISDVIKDFKDKVDEVLVVDNSSKDNTRAVALQAGARVETVRRIGYGDTIKYGLDTARGDILIVVEADFSFRSKDLYKILEYLKDSDMVIGTRTTRQMIEQGANMKGLLRWGNVFVGKLVEALWWDQEPRFTDVGCTYRGIWKDAYLAIRDRLHGVGPEFSIEMMIEALKARKRIIEIPISYYKREKGESKHSESYFKIAKTALRMLKVIFRKRSGFV